MLNRSSSTNSSQPPTSDAPVPGPWSPLRQPVFRALWIATVASNIGTWMQDVGAGWLMSSLTPSPLMVSLVQAATSLPMFLLALPAGAMADIVDRRRLLIFAEIWMLAAALGLGIVTVAGKASPVTLLAFTFLIGLGAAMSSPAWQAVIPEVVTREELPAAVALGSIGINVARALGPALGGMAIAALGPGAPFLLNAASFVGILSVLWLWKRPPREKVLPGERFVSAMRTGLRYAAHAPRFQAVLARTAAFVLPGSALWALLPLIARTQLMKGPEGYGILLGSLGAGAVAGAMFLPRLRRRFSVDLLTAVATVVFAGATVALALVRNFPLLCLAMTLGGGAWLTLLSTFNTAAQTTIPAWVRARAMAIYFMLVFFGAMSAGSVLWGTLATHIGLANTLLIAAAALTVGVVAVAKWRLAAGEGLNLAPSMHWPAPVVTLEPEPHDGPVLVSIEYRIQDEDIPSFLWAMLEQRRQRRRTGAMRWGLYRHLEGAGSYVETFVLESWAEHLRQHERVTEEDRMIEQKVRRFHRGEEPPRVSHWLAANFDLAADYRTKGEKVTTKS